MRMFICTHSNPQTESENLKKKFYFILFLKKGTEG